MRQHRDRPLAMAAGLADHSRTVDEVRRKPLLAPLNESSASWKLSKFPGRAPRQFNWHTGIFLVDLEAGFAVPHRSSPQNELAAESGRIPVNEDSLVGWCALHGEWRLATGVSQDAPFKPENNLPDTWRELVLPLRIGRRVLGVLDLQSNQTDAFGADDVVVMQSLADQLAIAIRNADLFDAAEAARAQADKASRLKSVFLSNMSHELRTPLSAIIGLAQAMMDSNLKIYSTPLPEEYPPDLIVLDTTGSQSAGILSDLLEMPTLAHIPFIVLGQPTTQPEMSTGCPRKAPVVRVAKTEVLPSTILQITRTCLQDTSL
jgi:hypothetical protein